MFFTLISSLSIDCPAIINLALSVKMDIKQPSIMNKINTDCCLSLARTTCVNERVTVINWSSLTLNGYLNLSLIPSEVVTLDVSFNVLTGSIHNIPSTLKTFRAIDNSLNGTFTIPSTLNYLEIAENLFTGPLVFLPSQLQVFLANNNKFTGNIQSILPPGLTSLQIANNLLNGSIPSLPTTLLVLYLSTNSITGSIPNLPPNLQTLNCYNMQLTGCLPTLPKSLLYIYLRGNTIQGPVSLFTPFAVSLSNTLISNFTIQDTSCLVAIYPTRHYSTKSINIPCVQKQINIRILPLAVKQ